MAHCSRKMSFSSARTFLFIRAQARQKRRAPMEMGWIQSARQSLAWTKANPICGRYQWIFDLAEAAILPLWAGDSFDGNSPPKGATRSHNTGWALYRD